MIGAPTIAWIQNDPHQHQIFEDGSKFLVALRVRNAQTEQVSWEYAVVVADCDGEQMNLRDQSGEYYGEWSWEDFDYFAVIEGVAPYSAHETRGGRADGV